MLKKSFVLSGLFILSLSSMLGKSIDDIVKNTLDHNYNIKSIESSLDIAKEQINLASKWKNPVLSFGATDIQLNDMFTRDKEAMQAHFIGFSQTIPLGDKLKIEKDIAQDEYKISKYELEDKKLQIKVKIYEYIYNIKLLEERVLLFEKYKTNTLKLEKLLKQLYQYNKSNQIQILNAQIMIKEIELKLQNLKNTINTLTLNLEQITYSKLENIDFDNRVKSINIQANIKKHPKLLALLQKEQKFKNKALLEKERKNSDITMNMSYFKRESKYEDYVNLSFAIPLSIRGSEDIKARKAKFKALEVNHKFQDMKFIFENKIKIIQQNIKDSIKNYYLIKNEILPKYIQVQKSLENYNSYSLYKNIDSKAFINNLNEIVKYELRAVDEKQKYFTALAKASYYKKEF